ncbi:MAG: ROK family protein [Planctomycetota bacterium]
MNSVYAHKPENYTLILRELMAEGGLSRAQLHRRTGLRPNTVGDVVEAMVAADWVQEGGNQVSKRGAGVKNRGRPAVRVEINERDRDVVGLALRPKQIEAVRLNLCGEKIGEVVVRAVQQPSKIAHVGAELLEQLVSERSLAVGVSSTGLLDDGDMKLLFSSSAPRTPGLSLGPVLTAAGELPIALEHDIHALGDRWRLAHPEAAGHTVLLIELGDGAVGASLMAAGGPADAGCVRGGNELGHMQVVAPNQLIPDCYCGLHRCVERMFSSKMLQRLGVPSAFAEALEAWGRKDGPDDLAIDMDRTPPPPGKPDEAIAWIMSLFSEAVANAVNLLRPHRVIWTGSGALSSVLPGAEAKLSTLTAHRLLPVLRERVRFERWSMSDEPDDLAPAVTAGFLALTMLTHRRLPAAGEVTLRPVDHYSQTLPTAPGLS